MPTADVYRMLVGAAARAPSADNMQAWAFANRSDSIAVHLDPRRVLPTDIGAMFAWVGLGAAIENLVIAAAHAGLTATVHYEALNAEAGVESRAGGAGDRPAAIVRLRPGGPDDPLAEWIERRETNRGRYTAEPLADDDLAELAAAVSGLDAGVHWVRGAEPLRRISAMDARSTYIRLEHRPLHDELFSVLRFSRAAMEQIRFGLEFDSLGLPPALSWVGRMLRYRPVMRLVSMLRIGRLVARQQASRLRSAQAVCLITALHSNRAGYIEAGRAMERLWLTANARGLAVQPHGVLPQYLTKLGLDPQSFPPRFADAMRRHREPFYALFPIARDQHPAIVLRLGQPLTTPRSQPTDSRRRTHPRPQTGGHGIGYKST